MIVRELDPMRDLARALAVAGGHLPAERDPGPGYVTPGLRTIGHLGACWCGEPMDHDWPGRADGLAHPRDMGGWQGAARRLPGGRS